MTMKDDPKRVERRARAMLISKDIPTQKMDVVRSLMNNDSLETFEKYSAIIDLVQSCPEKKVKRYDDDHKVKTRQSENKKKTEPRPTPVSGLKTTRQLRLHTLLTGFIKI